MSGRSEIRNLYHVRTRQGLTLKQLAALVRKFDPRAATRTTLNDFENGRHEGSVRTLTALSQVLGTPIEDLVRKVPAVHKPRGPRSKPAANASP